MLKIRLRRIGAKGRPMYRIVVADSRSPRDGRFIEILGSYNPLTDPPTISVDGERLEYWQSVGAQCTDSVTKLLGTLSRLEAQGEKATEEPEEEEITAASAEASASGIKEEGNESVDEETESVS